MADEVLQLEMKDITKQFGGVKVLIDASLKVKAGEVHALIGENGAGKSTLMKILSGAYKKDAGEIYLNAKKANITSPRAAINLGIAVIYQEFMLASDLTVAENIFIDKLSSARGLINWKSLCAKAKEQLSMLGFDDIDPNEKVANLSVAYQQVVEICKCLTRDAKILVLDEPTAVLTFAEIEKLFDVIKKLRENGVSIIYITHRLEELFKLCDRVTVLKDGMNVDTVDINSTDRHKLAEMMVGRDLSQMFPERHAKIGDVVLEVSELNAGRMVKDVSFSVRAGEVLGFSGLVGAGRTEAMRAIFGADRKQSGKVKYFGKNVDFRHPQYAVRDGLGMLPEDRKHQGLLLSKSIRINTTLASIRKVRKFGIVKSAVEKSLATKLLGDISTKYATIEDDVLRLSGGNQQKVSMAKWISADCKCIIFDEPTRGVDVGAKTEIYRVINNLAESGVAVIFISSEMPEIIGMCDRVVVMRNGAVAGEVMKEQLDEDVLIKYAMGVT